VSEIERGREREREREGEREASSTNDESNTNFVVDFTTITYNRPTHYNMWLKPVL